MPANCVLGKKVYVFQVNEAAYMSIFLSLALIFWGVGPDVVGVFSILSPLIF